MLNLDNMCREGERQSPMDIITMQAVPTPMPNMCGEGKRQSPMDIITKHAVPHQHRRQHRSLNHCSLETKGEGAGHDD
jgi:carbonic anhydrase